MQCPRCAHNVAGNRESCMYCGAFVADQIPLDAKDSSKTGKGKVFVEKDGKGSIAVNVNVDQKVYEKLEDIPESLQQKVEEVLREGGTKGFVEEKTVSYTSPESKSSPPFSTKPVEKILDTLAQIRHRLNDRQIDYGIYRAMVIGVMKDFIDSFHDDLKLNYVVNQIKDSPFAPYIDDEIYNELTKYFISKVQKRQGLWGRP